MIPFGSILIVPKRIRILGIGRNAKNVELKCKELQSD
jgi:hypothetical protein